MALIIFIMMMMCTICASQNIYVSDVNFRIEPGERMCVYESGKVGQMLEVYYQVLDGQHGDLDINFEVSDPKEIKLVSDFKKSENSIIMDLTVDGDYAFCMDNTFSMMNSKLVFLYILLEDKQPASDAEAEVAVVDADGTEQKEVLEWAGVDEKGETYYLELAPMADSLSTTLAHVIKSRHLLNIYAASKSRDSYMAFEDTFIVDVWSGFQISLMFVVGMLQVYMIKKLFNNAHHHTYDSDLMF
nr:transmembrane emp24 domain-containing protein 5-like [Helicoverpa armigera]